MAKFGEGDPRWLVEERVDGTNVNNWHWTEFNCTPWAKERLTALLENIIVKDDAAGYCRTTKVDQIGGEGVTVSCRKGKIIVFYELDIKLKWEGRFTNQEDCLGKIHLNIETDDDDYEIKVTSDKDTKDDRAFCDVIKTHCSNLVREKINIFLKELRTEHAQKVLKQVPQKQTSNSSANAPKPQQTQPSQTQSTTQTKKKPSKYSSIEIKTKFNASPREVYPAFLDAPRVSAFTSSQCSIHPTVGSPFSLFNGNITGQISELVPNKKIVQKWRFSNWAQDHFSEVTLNFEEAPNGTTILYLTQKGVPDDEKERTEQGWSEHFFRRMKMMHGWGNLHGD